MHPSIFISQEPKHGARTLAQIRDAITRGHAERLWQSILALAEQDMDSDPLVPSSMIEGREEVHAKWENPDWTICHAARRRVKRAAIAAAVTEERRYVDAALGQLDVLFDTRKWPRWRDKAHSAHPADLRTGMLGRDVAVAYDWLYPQLSAREQGRIIEGLERCAVAPFFASAEQGAWWVTGCSNWTTCVVGGLGIAGMAIGDDHPRARELVEMSLPVMEGYLGRAYGPEGEFNESVGYSAATRIPMTYFAALQCHAPEHEEVLSRSPFPEALVWYMHFVLPPGRPVAFGDGHWDSPPEAAMFALAAQATRNPAFQQFYLAHLPDDLRRDLVYELLWYDPEVEQRSPEGIIPRGKAYSAFGRCISSRSSWDNASASTVVCGKAGIEEHHEHHDMGQVTIDGYGERLIIDLGSPPGYPADFFGPNRYRYYNASSWGHNILVMNGQEMVAGAQGSIVASEFADSRGGWWVIDAGEGYAGALRVRRSVVHLTPCVVVVFDEADLREPGDVSLRWHTAVQANPDHGGAFSVVTPNAILGARIVGLAACDLGYTRGEQRYTPPFHQARTGLPLVQRYESYIEATARTARWRSLSLFAVSSGGPAPTWTEGDGGWESEVKKLTYRVSAKEDLMEVRESETGREWRVGL